MLNDTQKAWVGLNMTLAPRQIYSLVQNFSSVGQAWSAPLQTLEKLPGFERWAKAFAKRRSSVSVLSECHRIDRLGLQVVTLEDENYPQALRALSHPPPVLYAKGQIQANDAAAIAVVGTRRSTGYGRRVTVQLCGGLSRAGITVVSGLALGIDTVAHQTTLDAGGRTVAVLGSGFAHIYPPENRTLLKRIAQSGTVFSEFPIQTKPARWTFPRRNRVISGLCRGVLVVEGTQKSGSLITAKAALEQGRDVFAVPGPITHPNSKGCHYLLKHGAKLVETVDDILEELPSGFPKTLAHPMVKQPALNETQAALLKQLSFEPSHINTVIEASGMRAAQASAVLVELEMMGLVSETENKHYVKRP